VKRLFAPTTADSVVPPSGHTAWLTSFTAGAMTFLAVFALALAMASGRLAERWAGALERTATVRLSAPPEQIAQQEQAILDLLATTPGIAAARAIPAEEAQALLEPWFGPDLPVESLPIPQLIELTATEDGYDGTGLRARLQAEVPGAILDDHTEWRRPLVSAANRLRALGIFSLLLIAATSAAMITLAAKAALAANGQVIRVLRLIGTRDITIATAFVRRFTHRAAIGATGGTVLGMIAVALLPGMDAAGGFLTGLGFRGWGWLLPLLIPLTAAAVGFFATRWAALKMLEAVR